MVTELSFQEKTKLIADLRSTYTIYSRNHGLNESILIATGGWTRAENVRRAIGESVDVIGAEAGVRRVIDHAIQTIEGS